MAKISAIQMASGPQVQANLMIVGRLVREAVSNDADMVVLPESFGMMGVDDEARVAVAEEYGSGVMQDYIRNLAKDLKVWVVAGTIPLKTDDPDKATASCLVYDDKGEVVARYDKMHLFDAVLSEEKETYEESKTTVAGDMPVVVDTPFGKVGLLVCYDLRFPKLFRELVDRGAQIFTLPAAFTEATGKVHWEVLLRARAIENLAYMVAAGQGGYHVNGRTTYGHSMAIDYWGSVQSVLPKGAGSIGIEIDLDALEAMRKNFPVLQNRKL